MEGSPPEKSAAPQSGCLVHPLHLNSSAPLCDCTSQVLGFVEVHWHDTTTIVILAYENTCWRHFSCVFVSLWQNFKRDTIWVDKLGIVSDWSYHVNGLWILLCWVVILLPEKNKQKLDVSKALRQELGTVHYLYLGLVPKRSEKHCKFFIYPTLTLVKIMFTQPMCYCTS
jgi:hypothetical protein